MQTLTCQLIICGKGRKEEIISFVIFDVSRATTNQAIVNSGSWYIDILLRALCQENEYTLFYQFVNGSFKMLSC